MEVAAPAPIVTALVVLPWLVAAVLVVGAVVAIMAYARTRLTSSAYLAAGLVALALGSVLGVGYQSLYLLLLSSSSPDDLARSSLFPGSAVLLLAQLLNLAGFVLIVVGVAKTRRGESEAARG